MRKGDDRREEKREENGAVMIQKSDHNIRVAGVERILRAGAES